MGILHSDIIDIEQVPLGQLGVQVFDVGPERIETQMRFVEKLREYINTDIGLEYSMESIFNLVQREYPPALGMDVYSMPAGINLQGRVHTIPPHWSCKVFGPVWLRFILIAPNIKFNNDHVNYMGDGEYTYVSYAKDFKAIKKETLIDLTGTEESLFTIGTFMRGSCNWQPIPIEETTWLNSR